MPLLFVSLFLVVVYIVLQCIPLAFQKRLPVKCRNFVFAPHDAAETEPEITTNNKALEQPPGEDW